MCFLQRVKLEADFVKELRASPIAVHQAEANQQHYEVSSIKAIFDLEQLVIFKYQRRILCILQFPLDL